MIETLTKENSNHIPTKDLIYWIDKEFVQWRAKELFGRELDDEEIQRTTKFIEWGLSGSVFEAIDIAIDETISEKINGE